MNFHDDQVTSTTTFTPWPPPSWTRAPFMDAKGPECPVHGAFKCRRPPKLAAVRPDRIRVRQCVCVGGIAAQGLQCPSEGETYCLACNDGYKMDNKESKCVPQCTCPNGGLPAKWPQCKIPSVKCSTPLANNTGCTGKGCEQGPQEEEEGTPPPTVVGTDGVTTAPGAEDEEPTKAVPAARNCKYGDEQKGLIVGKPNILKEYLGLTLEQCEKKCCENLSCKGLVVEDAGRCILTKVTAFDAGADWKDGAGGTYQDCVESYHFRAFVLLFLLLVIVNTNSAEFSG